VANLAGEDFARFFSHSLDLLCIVSVDGSFRRMNPAWARTLGWTEEELQAVPFLDFVHPEDQAPTCTRLANMAGSAEPALLENRVRHKDGSYRWLRWNARWFVERSEIYATAHDITTQRLLESEVLKAVDRERARLGLDLHDGLCQTLAGIAALSFALSRTLAPISESASTKAVEITGLLNEAIRETRDLARGLGPVGLGDIGLVAALEQLAATVGSQFSVSCAVESKGEFPGHRTDVEAHLYRIAQEALRNAITHGQASSICISLEPGDGIGVLRVRDDGVGVSPETLEKTGMGLDSMIYRARLFGATLDVGPGSSYGTVVTCTFSLLNPSEDTGHAPGPP
jgi:PAS domain S-box-containing protein